MSGKNFWGPSIWKTIHSLAVAYTPKERNEYKAFIYSLQKLLPCPQCCDHLKQHLKTLPIDDYLNNNHNLFLWTYFLHDMVNRQLGKKSPSYPDIKAIYFKSMDDPDCPSCKLN